jgi:hypothetical protein
LGDVAGAPDCPVRPSTAAQPNGCLVVEGYKYPPTTSTSTIQAFNILHSNKSNRLHSKDTIQVINPLKVPKDTIQVIDPLKVHNSSDHLCFFVDLVCLVGSLFFLTSYSQAL